MKIVISGSMKFVSQMRQIVLKLQQKGCQVCLPETIEELVMEPTVINGDLNKIK